MDAPTPHFVVTQHIFKRMSSLQEHLQALVTVTSHRICSAASMHTPGDRKWYCACYFPVLLGCTYVPS